MARIAVYASIIAHLSIGLFPLATAAKPSNTALQRSGWIIAILAVRRSNKVVSIHERGTFQPPAERQTVRQAGEEAEEPERLDGAA